MPTAPKSKTPPGWWSLPKLEGSRAGVTAAINSNPAVPEECKAFLSARVAAGDAEFNSVRLDAHCTIHDGLENYSISLRRAKVL